MQTCVFIKVKVVSLGAKVQPFKPNIYRGGARDEHKIIFDMEYDIKRVPPCYRCYHTRIYVLQDDSSVPIAVSGAEEGAF